RLTPTPTGESEEDVSQPSSSSEPRRSGAGSASARSREADSDQVRYRFNGIGRGVPPQLVSEQEISKMADIRDLGGGGDDPEESTQRMIERIWESLTDIRTRMDQQAPVPPVIVPPGDGEAVPIAPVPLRVEVPFVAPVPPPPPVLLAEETVMQVEKFLRLQPPTYSGGPNPDTAEHWVHEIERVFATMRCPAADKVVLAAYQLRGFTLEWWRLKLQTTFAGKGRGWGGRQQFQQGRGRPEVEESQQSTARQPMSRPNAEYRSAKAVARKGIERILDIKPLHTE
ncbi:hypothetical protein Taro_008957, partial [Colocasia esculenta]|nr:hypothetical protein [Colocasia esculenta]